jgi:stage II sporulation protein E
MVGTMALAYRNEQASGARVLETALSAAASDIRRFSPDSACSDSYSVLSHFAADVRTRADEECELNEALTSLCEEVFVNAGFREGVIRAFGTTRPYFIMAGEDADGTMITAPSLRESLSSAVGYKLGVPEYFRRDEMVVMQCRAAEKYKLKSALATVNGSSGEPSGDTARSFMGADSYAYGLISDGMGSGEEARRTSLFVADFLSSTLGTGVGYNTAMHALNSVIRGRGEECSVSVDLFSLDLVGGEACFVKSGAAPSFIKRGDSLYRIKSETVPLGVIKEVDAERIGARICEGDKVIMLSDGILAGADECDWLVEFLGKGNDLSLADYAKSVVDAAVSHGGGADDISVLVIEICAA